VPADQPDVFIVDHASMHSAVRARMHADPPPAPGDVVALQLTRADPVSRSLEFHPAPA
jgi:hypothetical protein